MLRSLLSPSLQQIVAPGAARGKAKLISDALRIPTLAKAVSEEVLVQTFTTASLIARAIGK